SERVTDRLARLALFVVDADFEFLFEAHRELDHVERVRAEIRSEGRPIADCAQPDSQMIRDQCPSRLDVHPCALRLALLDPKSANVASANVMLRCDIFTLPRSLGLRWSATLHAPGLGCNRAPTCAGTRQPWSPPRPF